MMQRRPWIAAATIAVAAAAVLPACGRKSAEVNPIVPSFTANRVKAPLGSAIEATYTFTLEPAAKKLGQDYRVLAHFLDSHKVVLFTDDHLPPVPTSSWEPGKTYTWKRTVFVPVYPYVGDVQVVMDAIADVADDMELSSGNGTITVTVPAGGTTVTSGQVVNVGGATGNTISRGMLAFGAAEALFFTQGANAVQELNLNGATSGQFTLTLVLNPASAPAPVVGTAQATPATPQTTVLLEVATLTATGLRQAIESLPTVGVGNVSVTLAAGVFTDLAAAVAGLASAWRSFEPRADWVGTYAAHYRRVYRPAHARLRPLHHAAAALYQA